jgi:hypothetical protein
MRRATGRLVRDQQPGLNQQGTRHHHALPLPARKLVRPAIDDFLRIKADAEQGRV